MSDAAKGYCESIARDLEAFGRPEGAKAIRDLLAENARLSWQLVERDGIKLPPGLKDADEQEILMLQEQLAAAKAENERLAQDRTLIRERASATITDLRAQVADAKAEIERLMESNADDTDVIVSQHTEIARLQNALAAELAAKEAALRELAAERAKSAMAAWLADTDENMMIADLQTKLA